MPEFDCRHRGLSTLLPGYLVHVDTEAEWPSSQPMCLGLTFTVGVSYATVSQHDLCPYTSLAFSMGTQLSPFLLCCQACCDSPEAVADNSGGSTSRLVSLCLKSYMTDTLSALSLQPQKSSRCMWMEGLGTHIPWTGGPWVSRPMSCFEAG